MNYFAVLCKQVPLWSERNTCHVTSQRLIRWKLGSLLNIGEPEIGANEYVLTDTDEVIALL